MAIFSIVVMALNSFIVQGLQSGRYQEQVDEAVYNARQAINALSKEIREANRAQNGSYLLETVNPQEFAFYCDIDNDGQTEKVRYYRDGTILKKGVVEPSGSPVVYTGTEILVNQVQYVNNQAAPIFTYFDSTNAPVINPVDNIDTIRLVHFNLKLNVDPGSNPGDYDVDMDISIRNLKDNL